MALFIKHILRVAMGCGDILALCLGHRSGHSGSCGRFSSCSGGARRLTARILTASTHPFRNVMAEIAGAPFRTSSLLPSLKGTQYLLLLSGCHVGSSFVLTFGVFRPV